MDRSILVTGAAGFIGSNFVRMLLGRGERVKLVAFDKLTYAGNLANLQDLLASTRTSSCSSRATSATPTPSPRRSTSTG
jgi:dTDP-D-glucose 4,6-dehydratase